MTIRGSEQNRFGLTHPLAISANLSLRKGKDYWLIRLITSHSKTINRKGIYQVVAIGALHLPEFSTFLFPQHHGIQRIMLGHEPSPHVPRDPLNVAMDPMDRDKHDPVLPIKKLFSNRIEEHPRLSTIDVKSIILINLVAELLQNIDKGNSNIISSKAFKSSTNIFFPIGGNHERLILLLLLRNCLTLCHFHAP